LSVSEGFKLDIYIIIIIPVGAIITMIVVILLSLVPISISSGSFDFYVLVLFCCQRYHLGTLKDGVEDDAMHGIKIEK
jgi:hypothetical protein